jgi:hypothetical protein
MCDPDPAYTILDPGVWTLTTPGDSPGEPEDPRPPWVGKRYETCAKCDAHELDCWIKTLCCKEKAKILTDPEEECPLGKWGEEVG